MSTDAEDRRQIQHRVEVGLGSRTRLRILKALIKQRRGGGSLSTHKIKSLAGLKTKDAKKHIRVLVETGWIREIPLVEVKKYQLNLENADVEHLVKFFRKIGYV
ncbi:MAG: hypothetical protein ACE5Z5_10045 [Candidatus Bathyarchaeia archaeon]